MRILKKRNKKKRLLRINRLLPLHKTHQNRHKNPKVLQMNQAHQILTMLHNLQIFLNLLRHNFQINQMFLLSRKVNKNLNQKMPKRTNRSQKTVKKTNLNPKTKRTNLKISLRILNNRRNQMVQLVFQVTKLSQQRDVQVVNRQKNVILLSSISLLQLKKLTLKS